MLDMSLIISIICTFISAASMSAAVFSAHYSSRSAKSSEKSARIAENTYKKTIEPNVIAYIAPSVKEGTACHLVIENIGKDPARDINIIPSCGFPVVDYLQERFNNSFIYSGIPFLEPGGSRRVFIGFFFELKDIRRDKTPSITLEYNGIRETFPISYDSFLWDVEDSTAEVTQLKRIADYLEKN